MSEKTVFISYRRNAAGKGFARSLALALTHRGYDVFLDVDSVDAGKWAEQISAQVPARAHFLLILTPGALDRCADEADWVRREYELAVRHGRNVVPVREESVELGAAREACPAGMAGVFDLQIAALRQCRPRSCHLLLRAAVEQRFAGTRELRLGLASERGRRPSSRPGPAEGGRRADACRAPDGSRAEKLV
ncbi:MAG: toll/interleukin-1 receptor domain-containing protein [bacterium]|nr:toll/interleukin-1 receptor domain-containing protein [bacterium]